MQDDGTPGSLHFGVPVYALTSKSDPVPMVVEMMLEHVEMNGLYTEGIYRKSGSTIRARELYQLLETGTEDCWRMFRLFASIQFLGRESTIPEFMRHHLWNAHHFKGDVCLPFFVLRSQGGVSGKLSHPHHHRADEALAPRAA